MADIVRTLRIKSTSEGIPETTAALGKLSAAQRDAGNAATSSASGPSAYEQALAKQLRQLDLNLQMMKQFEAANNSIRLSNDNLSRSYAAANDNVQGFSRSLVDGASSVLGTVGHLKLLALGAYALFPAFRGLVNTGAAQAIGYLGPAAGIASTAMSGLVSVLGPALSFLSRIAVPITIAVAAFKLLSSTISTGTDLLDKYGIAGQRKLFDDPQLAATLEKLTRFQGDMSTATLQEQTYAANLSGRLEEAKRQISDILNVQGALNGAALRLQNVWVVIVETIAKAATLLANLPQNLKFTNTPASSPTWFLGGRSEADIVRGLNEQNGTIEKQISLDEALLIAEGKLAAGLGGGFSGRFNGIVDNTPKEKPDDVKEVADAWTRYADQVTKATAAREADIRTVGLGVQAHEQMSVQLKGESILERKGVEDTAARRAELEKLAKQAGETAQELALLKAQNQADFTSKTMFFSPEDLAVAQAMNQIWGNDWPQHTQDNLAQQIKFNTQLAQTRDLLSTAFSGIVNDLIKGVSLMDALANAAGRLGQQLIDIGSKQIFNQLMGAVAASGSGQTFSGDGSQSSMGGGAGGGVFSAGLSASMNSLGSLSSVAGPIALVAGAALSIWSASEQKRKQAAEEQARASAAWTAAAEQLRVFIATSNGKSAGALQPALSSETAKAPTAKFPQPKNDNDRPKDDSDRLIVRRDRLHIFSDAAHYDANGIVNAIAAKVEQVPSWPGIVALRGATHAASLLAHHFGLHAPTFDRLLEIVEGLYPMLMEEHSDQFAGQVTSQLFVGGWSDARQQMELYFITNCDTHRQKVEGESKERQ